MFILHKILKFSGIFKSAGIKDEKEQKQYTKVVAHTIILVTLGITLYLLLG